MFFNEIKKEQVVLIDQPIEMLEHQLHHFAVWKTNEQFQCIFQMIMTRILNKLLK